MVKMQKPIPTEALIDKMGNPSIYCKLIDGNGIVATVQMTMRKLIIRQRKNVCTKRIEIVNFEKLKRNPM